MCGEKVFEPGLEKQMWKERERERKERKTLSKCQSRRKRRRKMANVTDHNKKPCPGTKLRPLTSVRQSLSPRAPSLRVTSSLRGHSPVLGQAFAGGGGTRAAPPRPAAPAATCQAGALGQHQRVKCFMTLSSSRVASQASRSQLVGPWGKRCGLSRGPEPGVTSKQGLRNPAVRPCIWPRGFCVSLAPPP